MMKIRKNLRLLLALLPLTLFAGCGQLPKGQEEVYASVKKEISADGEMTVHFLDVGQGLSILVQSDGENLLYDGGDRKKSSFVVSYLKKQKVEEIDYLIASHYDADHISGLVGCLNTFDIDTVIGPDYEQDSNIYKSFIDKLKEDKIPLEHPKVGTEYDFGTGSFTVLAPKSIGSNDNDNSVAIRLTNGVNSFLFTGDAEHESEEAMITSGLELESDVLCLGHHGSATATSWDFLEETLPEYAVISCGAGNSYGHPHKDTMDKLRDMEIAVFRTDVQKTIIAKSDGTSITWNQKPCNDYTPGDKTDKGTVSAGSSSADITDKKENNPPSASNENEVIVWRSATGSKYHRIPDCGTMNPQKASQLTRQEAEKAGLEACKKCF